MIWLAVAGLIILWVTIAGSPLYFLADQRLEEWAQSNNFQILQKKYYYDSFMYTPFRWSTGGFVGIYYVSIEEENRNQRTGWVCFGNWYAGLWSNKIRVIWEEQEESKKNTLAKNNFTLGLLIGVAISTLVFVCGWWIRQAIQNYQS